VHCAKSWRSDEHCGGTSFLVASQSDRYFTGSNFGQLDFTCKSRSAGQSSTEPPPLEPDEPPSPDDPPEEDEEEEEEELPQAKTVPRASSDHVSTRKVRIVVAA
jgi:hypothetical protein